MVKLGLGLVFVLSLSAVACAATPAPKAVQAEPVEASSEPATEKEEPTSTTTTLAAAIPSEPQSDDSDAACAGEISVKDVKACTVTPAFVKRLCSAIYPEATLGLFAKGTPFTRVWMAGDVEAWNASAGLSRRAKLGFDEEVIVLGKHQAASTGGIVMTGTMASYDVVRADGTCFSVMEGELTTRRPPAPKSAAIAWGRLEEPTRHALLGVPKVKAAYDAVTKACSGDKTKACDKADAKLAQAILDAVRNGVELPKPVRKP